MLYLALTPLLCLGVAVREASVAIGLVLGPAVPVSDLAALATDPLSGVTCSRSRQ